MKFKLSKFVYVSLRLVIPLSIASFFSAGVIYATTLPYATSDAILDPSCGPHDTNCYVNSSSGGAVDTGNGLSASGSTVELGGSGFTHDTKLGLDGHQFEIDDDFANTTNQLMYMSNSTWVLGNSDGYLQMSTGPQMYFQARAGGNAFMQLASGNSFISQQNQDLGVDAAGFYVLNISDSTDWARVNATTVKFSSLANTDSTKFLQADSNGKITSVTVPGGAGIVSGSGLTNNFGTFELGGALAHDTDIDPGASKFTINQNHNSSEPLLDLESAFTGIGFVDDIGNINDIEINSFYTYINRNSGAAMQISDTLTNFVDHTGPYTALSRSAVSFAALANTDSGKFLQADINGNITSVSVPSGGGGGSADNGLTLTGSNVQLGGTLMQDTNIPLSGYELQFGNTSGGPLLDLFSGGITLQLTDSPGVYEYTSLKSRTIDTGFDGAPALHLTPTDVQFPALANSDSGKFVQADSSGMLHNVSIPGGGSGGGVSAGSGLTNNSGIFDLGGSLSHDTYIDPGAYQFAINGNVDAGKGWLDVNSGQAHFGVVNNSGGVSDIFIDDTDIGLSLNGGGTLTIVKTIVDGNPITSFNLQDGTSNFVTFTPNASMMTALANTDSTKFLQADSSGHITNVSIPSGGGLSGSGTSGQLTYWNGSSTVAGDTNLTWDSGSVRLGIAAATPGYTLTVGSSSLASGIIARFENADGTCDVNPTLGAGGFTCSSDARLKKNIVRMSDNTTWAFNPYLNVMYAPVLSKILALAPVTYNWNKEPDPSQKHAGFVAQEVREIFPGLVSEDPVSHLLSVNYSGLIPYTVEAIQEMDIQVQAIPVLQDKTLYVKIASFLRGIAEQGTAMVNRVETKDLETQNVQTDKLCVGTTCVTQDQFLKMVNQVH